MPLAAWRHKLGLAGLLALCLMLLLGPLAAQAQVLTLKQALSAWGDGPRFPADAPTRIVSLPDDWADSRPREAGPMWYRAAFDAPGVRESGQLLALYVEQACSSIEVQLNGHRVHLGGRLQEPVSRHCQYPQLVPLPAALLEPRGNLLDVKVVGEPLQRVASQQRAGGLSMLQLGPWHALESQHRLRMLVQVTLPQMVSAVLVLLGIFMFVMGGLNRRDSHLAYFGALSIGWALFTARLWWADVPVKGYDAELLLVCLMPLIALAAVQFLLRYAGWRSRQVDISLYVQCAVVPLSMLMAGSNRVHPMATGWFILLALEVAAAAAFYLWTAYKRQRSRFWPMSSLFGVIAALTVLQLFGQQRPIDPMVLALSGLAIPVGFVLLGLGLMQQYGRALQSAEQNRQSLESRVREATEQIERNFAQLAELRVEQVTERERKRIAADLHDDLGAKLLTIVHTSESDRIATLAREALEEMRLSVRGLTGKPVQLIDALGDWRAEVVSRLAQTGIEAEWSAPAEELGQTLSARAYVQTTRILREAVNNIIKHSGASRCAVQCRIEGTDFQLAIQDNGKGIPMELDGRLDRGHGMTSMKHRAKQLQGQCLVESGPGYGTVIRLTIPLDRHAATV